MPKKIPVHQRTKFWRLREQGYSILEASRRAGFSESFGKALVRNYGKVHPVNAGATIINQEIDAEFSSRPKRYHELCPEAQRAYDDFGYFRHRYLGSISVDWQVEGAHMVLEHLESDEDSYGVVNAPQGSGKTRLFTHDIPAWLTARDRTLRGCLGSGTMVISERMTGLLRATLARSSPVTAADRWKRRGMAADAVATLAQDFGRFRPSQAGITWTRGEFTVEPYFYEGDDVPEELRESMGVGQDKEATWAAFSYEAQVMSLRFDFMQWDDLHTSRDLRNPDGMEAMFDWWEVEAESRLDPGGLLLVTMQRLGANDISRHLLDKIDPGFEIDADRPDAPPKQYFHVTFKAHYDDRCQGQHASDAPSYPEGCMLDPKRITWQKINAKKVSGTYEIVYQQEDTDPASVLVQKEWVSGGRDSHGTDHIGCWDPERVVGQLPTFPAGATVLRYMTVDPSATNWWALIDTVYVLPPDTEPNAGYRYVIDVARRKMGANDFLDRDAAGTYRGLAEDWVKRAKEQGVPIGWLIMERNACQRWAMQYSFFQDWWRSRGVEVRPHETQNNKADPDLGVWATLPSVYRFGRVRLPGADRASQLAMAPLVHEVTTYPGGATFDCGMSQWFGEYHLPNLVGASRPSLPFHTDQPSWLGGRRQTYGQRALETMLAGTRQTATTFGTVGAPSVQREVPVGQNR